MKMEKLVYLVPVSSIGSLIIHIKYLLTDIRRSPRKVEKRPVYVLNLVVPPATVDNTLEPAKTHILFQASFYMFSQNLTPNN